MLFGTLMWIIVISLIPTKSSPEFVVHEIEACCHHRITLSCLGGDDGRSDGGQQMKIAVVQARYVIDEEEQIAAAPSTQPLYPFPGPTQNPINRDNVASSSSSASDNHPPSNNLKTISLWDLDVKFVHHLTNENLPHPIHVNAPPWHPAHISTYEGKQPFLFQHRKFTTPPVFPEDGLNFTASRVIEMPPYKLNFLDKDSIWREPLFHIEKRESTIPALSTLTSLSSSSASFVTPRTGKRSNRAQNVNTNGAAIPTLSSTSSRESQSESTSSHYLNFEGRNGIAECWSYQALSSTSATFTANLNNKIKKPSWHFKDLRAYFNQRCSGRNKCTVELLRGKRPDPDVAKLCHLLPEGKVTVKYLCYNTSSENVHSRCNIDVMPANEGFLHNPGYPDLYPGDQPCQWRLHVAQQKILLVFFDISLRGQEKSICKDELVASEEHSKLLSTCGDVSSAVGVLSERDRLNVTLISQSRLAYPKRGFLIYYRVLGCLDPVLNANSYMVFRNATHAYMLCDMGFLRPETLKRDQWIFCNSLQHTWTKISHCQDIRSYNRVMGNLSIAQVLRNNPSLWPIRHREEKPVDQIQILTDIILPICVMIGLFTINGIVLFFIWRQRQRMEEMEENERNQTQEMEAICAAVVEDSNSPVDESSFSFPSSPEDLWHSHDPFEDIEDTDQDRTLTTLTLHTSSPPDSAAAMKHYYDPHPGHAGNGYYRMSQDGSLSGLFSSTGTATTSSSYLPQQQNRFNCSHGPLTLNLANGSGLQQHSGGNGSAMSNGNGGFSGTYYLGYARTTAV